MKLLKFCSIVVIVVLLSTLTSLTAQAHPIRKPIDGEGGGAGIAIGRYAAQYERGTVILRGCIDVGCANNPSRLMPNWRTYTQRYFPQWQIRSRPYVSGGSWKVDAERTTRLRQR